MWYDSIITSCIPLNITGRLALKLVDKKGLSMEKAAVSQVEAYIANKYGTDTVHQKPDSDLILHSVVTYPRNVKNRASRKCIYGNCLCTMNSMSKVLLPSRTKLKYLPHSVHPQRGNVLDLYLGHCLLSSLLPGCMI